MNAGIRLERIEMTAIALYPADRPREEFRRLLEEQGHVILRDEADGFVIGYASEEVSGG